MPKDSQVSVTFSQRSNGVHQTSPFLFDIIGISTTGRRELLNDLRSLFNIRPTTQKVTADVTLENLLPLEIRLCFGQFPPKSLQEKCPFTYTDRDVNNVPFDFPVVQSFGQNVIGATTKGTEKEIERHRSSLYPGREVFDT